MQRERQIELLVGASARADARAVAWLTDPEVKKVIRANHEMVRELKSPRVKRASC